MADAVTVTGVVEVRELLGKLPERMFKSAKKAIGIALLNSQRETASYKGGLVNRSGRLRRSIITEIAGTTIKDLSGSLSTNTPYALIQEKGGTITARDKYLGVPGGPYLNIPLSANKTAKGVMRENARSVFARGGFIIKSKKGKYLVMSKSGQPMFVLVKQVVIPARLGMEEAALDEVPTLLSTLNDSLLKGL